MYDLSCDSEYPDAVPMLGDASAIAKRRARERRRSRRAKRNDPVTPSSLRHASPPPAVGLGLGTECLGKPTPRSLLPGIQRVARWRALDTPSHASVAILKTIRGTKASAPEAFVRCVMRSASPASPDAASTMAST